MTSDVDSMVALSAGSTWMVCAGPEETLPVPDTRMVGGWIRWHRTRARLSQKATAIRMGTSTDTLVAVETGRRALIQMETAVRIADALRLSREELVIRAVWDFRTVEDR
ncbi:helix-turn-helix domain-containing protein [Amycolatopsis sp. WQ 127309]|uniref:helix-turn-helix domain-containing protein n=1 Tax=Amycolatopsis sp. WQ 127309 TaxID=2932773 RepID=UPI001FF4151E|nr:helix-turn-helix transcriptional regulator [Amycolatopsis sp. WQ 127309]UOZ07502.1 helix-turn-helix domain-containing protein [Amycolatopsis sp. WQ 127309]